MIKNGAGCGVYCIAFSASLSMHSFLYAFVLGFVFVLGVFFAKRTLGEGFSERSLSLLYTILLLLLSPPGLDCVGGLAFFPFACTLFFCAFSNAYSSSERLWSWSRLWVYQRVCSSPLCPFLRYPALANTLVSIGSLRSFFFEIFH